MKQAIVSDLHSNVEAMTAVLEDIKSQKVDEIICLGDVVGYGPQPNELIDIAQEHFAWTIKGNHDEAVIGTPIGFNPQAKKAIDWTRKVVKPGLLGMFGGKKAARWKYLQNLETIRKEGRVTYVHGSPIDHVMDYVLKTDAQDLMGGVTQKVKDIFNLIEWAVFVGHTHHPGVITIVKDAKSQNGTGRSVFIEPQEVSFSYKVNPKQKAIINVGSVGQPRDHDNRACYAIWDGETVKWRRVEYDYEATMKKILDIPELGNRNAERLAAGE
ncbi:MAG: metallophosphoesterase family protein [Planctomycetes bacterium]|nr:metallophosphoesterase family protein [Planctomycetota bacterium]